MLHQVFTGAPRFAGFEAERFGNRRLHVEYQPVFAPVGVQVQADPDVLEGAFLLGQLARLGRRDQAALGQLAPGISQAGGLGHPQDHLQVAQAARAFLAIRFEAVGRVFVFDVTLPHFERLGQEKSLRIHRRVAAFAQELE